MISRASPLKFPVKSGGSGKMLPAVWRAMWRELEKQVRKNASQTTFGAQA